MAITQKKYPKAACSIMQDISCWMGWVPHIILQRMIVILAEQVHNRIVGRWPCFPGYVNDVKF
jgi:hypothetical protein